MERIQAVCTHPKWQAQFELLQQLEQDRVFCRHTLEHFLDVARIAWIETLERGLDIPKPLIYAAALLHDLGRAEQYLHGTPHDRAGAALAREIMEDCGFSAGEQAQVTAAIAGHRSGQDRPGDDLTGVLYRADKTSRICLLCPAREQCNWAEEKKNMKITV